MQRRPHRHHRGRLTRGSPGKRPVKIDLRRPCVPSFVVFIGVSNRGNIYSLHRGKVTDVFTAHHAGADNTVANRQFIIPVQVPELLGVV